MPQLIEKEMTTTIDGFKVELSLYVEDGEQRSSCFISNQADTHTSSLEFLDHEGFLDSHDSREPIDVSRRTTQRIRDWAEANGY